MDNEVAVVDGIPISGKVVNQEDIKLFRCKVVLSFLDSTVYDFKHTRFEVRNPVRVYNADHEPLGYANVNVVGNKLVADISINYSCEERLLTETKQEKFYPSMVGSMRLVTPSIDLDTRSPVEVSFCVIDSLVLTRKQPKDNRIPVFGEIVL